MIWRLRKRMFHWLRRCGNSCFWDRLSLYCVRSLVHFPFHLFSDFYYCHATLSYWKRLRLGSWVPGLGLKWQRPRRATGIGRLSTFSRSPTGCFGSTNEASFCFHYHPAADCLYSWAASCWKHGPLSFRNLQCCFNLTYLNYYFDSYLNLFGLEMLIHLENLMQISNHFYQVNLDSFCRRSS